MNPANPKQATSDLVKTDETGLQHVTDIQCKLKTNATGNSPIS